VGGCRNGGSERSAKFDDGQALSVRNSTLVYFVDARDCLLSSQAKLYCDTWDQNIDFGLAGDFPIVFLSYYQLFQPHIECVGGD
jgi:hypothetical protein